MSQSAPISVAEICRELERRALDVCMDLFGSNGHATAVRFTVGGLTGEPGASLSVRLVPNKRGKIGVWKDFATGEAGDLLDLIRLAYASECHGDKGKAVKWAREFLGMDGKTIDRAALKRKHDEARRKAEQKAKADADRKRGVAWKIWGIEAEPDWRGTPVEFYLRDGRAIRTDLCGSLGALRYHPDCLVYETGELLPAMVAIVAGPEGKFAAVHRTYLEQGDDGIWRKATSVLDHKGRPEPKRSLGEVMGGHISLNKGKSGVSLRRAPAGDICIIVEGIENGLSLVPAAPEYRCVAAVSLANMSEIVMPRTIATRILVRDAALMKPEAEAGFSRAVQFHKSQCDDVRVVDFGNDDANAHLQRLRQGVAA